MTTMHAVVPPPPLHLTPGERMLIIADDWFAGPDGIDYKRVWGPTKIVAAKDLLGLEPRNSANWFAAVGPDGHEVLIAGCRIHYAARCSERPKNMQGTLDMGGKEQ